MQIIYEPALIQEDLKQILALQQKNLRQNISPDEANQEGFVTVEHNLEVLTAMTNLEPSMVAKVEGKVVGYCLGMHPDTRTIVPALGEFFEKIYKADYLGASMMQYSFIVVGQVCIAKEYRGMGIFDGMYQAYRVFFQDRYRMAVTEVADSNQRSLKAHYRVGFQDLIYYQQGDGRWWHLIGWDWNTTA